MTEAEAEEKKVQEAKPKKPRFPPLPKWLFKDLKWEKQARPISPKLRESDDNPLARDLRFRPAKKGAPSMD